MPMECMFYSPNIDQPRTMDADELDQLPLFVLLDGHLYMHGEMSLRIEAGERASVARKLGIGGDEYGLKAEAMIDGEVVKSRYVMFRDYVRVHVVNLEAATPAERR